MYDDGREVMVEIDRVEVVTTTTVELGRVAEEAVTVTTTTPDSAADEGERGAAACVRARGDALGVPKLIFGLLHSPSSAVSLKARSLLEQAVGRQDARAGRTHQLKPAWRATYSAQLMNGVDEQTGVPAELGAQHGKTSGLTARDVASAAARAVDGGRKAAS